VIFAYHSRLADGWRGTLISAPIPPTISGCMAKHRTRASEGEQRAVTAERAARLYRLLRILASSSQSRESLKKRLHLDVRGFYRDLELLRSAGITVPMRNGRYALEEDVEEAIARLPFPDPRLTLGEAVQLARGRMPAHRKLKEQLTRITGASGAKQNRGARGAKSRTK
jgi:hypothetical protein